MGAISGAVRAEVPAISQPLLANEVIASAGVEQSYAFPLSTKFFLIKNRADSVIQYSYVSTESGTNYRTLYLGESLIIENISRSGVLTIYFQSPKAGGVLEIESWT